MRILVVDDNEDNLYMLETLLRGNGYEVLCAHNGVEAIHFLNIEGADLIISDIMMPKMDGFQLCRTIKADDTLKRKPFVFYTATYTDPKDVELGISLGADRFLIKPQDTDVLLQAIIDVIAEHTTIPLAKMHPLGEEMEFFRQYNDVLFRKLEKKIADFEAANQALKESETRFRSMFEQSPIAYQSLDENGCYTYVNEQLCQLLGYGPEELIGKSFGDLCTLITKEIFKEKISDFLMKGYVRAELQLHRKDDKEIEVYIEGRIQRDAHGKFISTHCILFDITERKRLEESLQASVRQMNAILTNIPDIAWLKDTESRFIAVNAQFVLACGKSPAEIVGKNDFDIWPKDLAEHYRADDEEVMRSKTSKRVDEKLVGYGGKEIWIETIKTPVLDAKGNVIGTTGIARDITARKRLESERHLLEEQLRQAQKMEAIGQMAGGVAHDFNNILTAILGYSSIIQSKLSPDDPNLLNIKEVIAAANRATVLTQTLLAFSRKHVVNLLTIDLNEVVASFKKFLLRLLREDIELSTRQTEQKLFVRADRGQLEQVLMNLVTNARDAMPKGGRIVIETGLERIDEHFFKTHGFGQLGGDYVTFSVIDTGIGIADEIKNKIYDPFFTTKEQDKGTGLGLSMVYGIVKKHQGYIDVSSRPETGTAFKIYLPVASEADVLTEQKIAVLPQPLKGGQETLLIAEDDMSSRILMSRVLRQYGYNVLEAVDGLDAVTRFMENRQNIKLVVLDGIMPKMNGKEAWEEINALSPGFKVLFISGYTDDIFTATAIPDLQEIFIPKPVTPSVLLRKVREILDK